MKIRITKMFSFEMAHALPGHDGACRNIHGHSYRLEVTLLGEPRREPGHPKDGMVMDFKDLKAIVKKEIVDVFDHALVLPHTSYNQASNNLGEYSRNIVLMPFQPTCENLLIHIVDCLRKYLPEHLQLVGVRLHETATSFAEWNYHDEAN